MAKKEWRTCPNDRLSSLDICSIPEIACQIAALERFMQEMLGKLTHILWAGGGGGRRYYKYKSDVMRLTRAESLRSHLISH